MSKKNKLRIICERFNIDYKLCAKLLGAKSERSMLTMLNPSYKISKERLRKKTIKLLVGYQAYIGRTDKEINYYLNELYGQMNDRDQSC